MKLNELLAELVMGWLRPTTEETEVCLRERLYELRHWTIQRHSGKPPENLSSFYWTPPPFSSSAIFSRMLREKLAEKWAVWTFSCEGGSFEFRLYAHRQNLTWDHSAYFDTEEMAVALTIAPQAAEDVLPVVPQATQAEEDRKRNLATAEAKRERKAKRRMAHERES